MKRSVLVAAGILLLAVGAGALWAWVSPKPDFVVRGDRSGLPMSSMTQIFGGVGWFIVISSALGLLIALLVWFALPRTRGLGGLAYTVVAATAASWIATESGSLIGDAMTPVINPHRDGRYPTVIDLWLTDATLFGVPAPWILLVCAPGVAALACFFLATASARQDLGVGDLPEPESPRQEPPVTAAAAE